MPNVFSDRQRSINQAYLLFSKNTLEPLLIATVTIFKISDSSSSRFSSLYFSLFNVFAHQWLNYFICFYFVDLGKPTLLQQVGLCDQNSPKQNK